MARRGGRGPGRRSLTDFEWADEVIRRHQRRRYRVQQRERAIADLRRELVRVILAITHAFAPR